MSIFLANFFIVISKNKNKMNTIENNKIISEFLGQKKTISNFPQFGYMTSSGNWKDEFTPNELKFHSDWNWLMEAAEKIESLGYWVEILGGMHNVCSIGLTNNIESFIYLDSESKIEAVYNAVVEFIKWYNLNLSINNK